LIEFVLMQAKAILRIDANLIKTKIILRRLQYSGLYI